MLTTYQPNLLITSDYDVAKLFLLTKDQKVTNKTFSQILNEIDHNNPRILISPRKNNQYFESFDFNVGYDRDSVFSINVSFVDTNNDFERLFVEFIFSEEEFKNKIKEFVDLKSSEDIGSIINAGMEFNEDAVSLIVDDYSNTINNKYSFNRTFYFVFGINDSHNSVIASNYIYSEVTQSSEGYKKLKVNFQNTGHPLVLSNLNKLQINKNSLESIYYESSYKLYSIYEYAETVDLVKIVRDGNLDNFLKKVIKKLFNKITQKEVIVLLPNFNKIYENFKTKNSKSSRVRALELGTTLISSEAQLLVKLSYAEEYYKIVEFLNFLGFNVESKLQEELQNYEKNIPIEIIEKIQQFKNDPIIKELLSKNFVFDKDPRIRALEYSSEERDKIDFANTQRVKEQFLKTLIGYYFFKDDLIKKTIDPLGEVNPSLPLDELLDQIIAVIAKKTGDTNLDKIVDIFFKRELRQFIGITPERGSAELSLEDKFRTNFGNTIFKFAIINKSDGTSYSNDDIVPQINNFINFESFISQFSNNLTRCWETHPFKIGFYEECDLNRLKYLQDYVIDFYESDEEFLPLIKNETQPAIVIAEDFLFRNLYLPTTRLNENISNVNYPYSENDLISYGKDSLYHEMLRNEKQITKKYINSSFNENLNTDVLDYANSVDNDNSNDPVYPVFIANDTRSNILSYSLEVDKLYHTNSYYEYIEYVKKQIINELVLEKSRSIYGKFLKYDEIKKDLLGYINSHKNLNLEEIFSKVVSNIKQGKAPYYLNTGEYTTRATIDDPFGGYGDDGSRYATRFREASPEAVKSSSQIAEDLVQHLYLQILNDLSQQSRKDTPTFKVTTDIKFNPLLLKKKLLRELYQKMFKVSIKTLPFFNFNNLEKLYSGAFLIIKNISNPSFGIGDTYSFLTGVYMIQSFRHVINQTSCYSEFILLKDVDIGGIEG